MPLWSDLYKLFNNTFRADPISELEGAKSAEGATQTQPDLPPFGSDGFWSGGKTQLRVNNDFVDLSSVTNRQNRYREYERLRAVPEIELALTVFADESCVSGDTKVATPFGYVRIDELAKQKKPGERFMVYAYDFKKQDWNLAWGHSPRQTKVAPTVRVVLADGRDFVCTADHRVLLRDGRWLPAGELKPGAEMMAFYRERADHRLTNLKTNQFPRIFSYQDGWKHERQMIDEWRSGKKIAKYERVNKLARLIASGMLIKDIKNMVDVTWRACEYTLHRHGFSFKELRHLAKTCPDSLRVVGVFPHDTIPVYDMTVDGHENFATDSVCFHNCQTGENGHMFEIKAKDGDVKEEAEFLLYDLLEVEETLWSDCKNLYLLGDLFYELCILPENPKAGVLKLQRPPADSMYRIETTRGKLLEFQQSKDGPDIESLARVNVTQASEQELNTGKAMRFTPEQIVHMKIGDDRRQFYPYGVSMVEAARSPAHQLRLMEDSMVVYRLSRAPERRVFYIDIGTLPPNRAEAYIDQLKDKFRKKKIFSNKAGVGGASAVEERWQTPSQDEDFWMPLRPNSNTRIETLPGAQNLGEIDDALYFRNKLFIALNFPKNYAGQDDPQQTRITLSSQDVKFARLIERLQKAVAKGLKEIVVRHLMMKGYPEERYHDLQIRMTPPSDWREISRNEVTEARYNRAAAMKGAQLMSDYDILVDILKFDPDKAKEYVARMKQQKMEDAKLQVMVTNPEYLGLGNPPDGEKEIGADASGPNPDLSPPDQQGQPGPESAGDDQSPPADELSGPAGAKPKAEPASLPTPSKEAIQKYNLNIRSYDKEIDEEEVDTAELGE